MFISQTFSDWLRLESMLSFFLKMDKLMLHPYKSSMIYILFKLISMRRTAKYYTFLLSFILLSFGTRAQTIDSTKTIPDTLLFKIQKAQSVVTEVNAANKKGYSLDVISNAVSTIKQDIQPIKLDLGQKNKEIDVKNLQSYELLLNDAQERLTRLRNALIKSSNSLQGMVDQVVALSNDTVLEVSAKEGEKRLYAGQLKDIRLRLQQSGNLTGKNLDQVGQLLADVSALDITVNDLKNQVTEGLQRSGKVALGREVPLLWETPWKSPDEGLWAQLSSSYQGQKKILSFFLETTWDKRFLTILFSLAFFIWVHRNFRLSQRAAVKRKIGELQFNYLKPFPILATLIVGLSIIPLLETGAPSLYIELTQLLLMLVITIHLRKVLPTQQLKRWLQLIIAFAILVFVSSINSNALWLRVALLALNVFFIMMGLRMFRAVKIQQFPKKYTRVVVIIFVVFNCLALLLNIFGRLSLAKAFALTGLVGLIQLIGLAVFVQLLLDALELQLKISSCSKGIFSRVEHIRVRASAKKVLHWVALLLWVMVFFVNMNLTHAAWSFFEAVLAKERTFGSVHFTLGNILLFVVIIYLANKLQKNVPIIFGDGNLSYEAQVEHKSSKVALVRLIIIVLAVLLALTASGLPMDRLTVVLGALGVGIGLGMQNIVNNFVSGIILIFERPFRIGDFVELADKKGRVKDIGIRSSRLVTQQGAEVIIPNGDLLSGRLVNWTLSHDYVKSEFLFKVPIDTDLNALKKMIEEQVAKTEHGMSKMPVEILVNSMAGGNVELKVLAWVENIHNESHFKSELMAGLLQRMNEAEIKVM